MVVETGLGGESLGRESENLAQKQASERLAAPWRGSRQLAKTIGIQRARQGEVFGGLALLELEEKSGLSPSERTPQLHSEGEGRRTKETASSATGYFGGATRGGRSS